MATTTPKFPHVKVAVNCQDGKAFSVMSKVMDAMRAAGIDKADRDAFFADATAAACGGVLATARKYVTVQ